jgi:hypothetical protein
LADVKDLHLNFFEQGLRCCEVFYYNFRFRLDLTVLFIHDIVFNYLGQRQQH